MNTRGSILIVEDDADDVFFMTRALQESGLKAPVEVVRDGQSAIRFLENVSSPSVKSAATKPSLVLLDLNLPVKPGLEVLKWIRQESSWGTIVVLVFTSSTSEADMLQAYLLGANSYVIKPSDGTKLTQLAGHIKDFWFGWNQLPPPLPAPTHKQVNG